MTGCSVRNARIRFLQVAECQIWGSHLYGTHNDKSDTDIIIISNVDKSFEYTDEQENIDFQIYNKKDWELMLKRAHIMALECYFQNDPIKHYEFFFDCDYKQIRHSISAVVSNSWVKAKKKVLVENEPHKGYKSMFHSIRILDFAIQIGEYGGIVDYKSANIYFNTIINLMNEGKSFKEIESKMKKVMKEKKRYFKQLFPK